MRNKKRRRLIKVFVFSVLIVGVSLLSILFYPTGKPHHDLVDSKISLYSNKNITKNAIEAKPEFHQIVFEPKIKKSFLTSQIATVVTAIKSFKTDAGKEPLESGSWVWTPILNMTPEYTNEIITGAKQNNINVLYVSIDSYLDIFVMPKNSERAKTKETFENKLEYLIKQANQKGIAVDAEAGWQNWAEAGHTYKALAVINFVKNFNNEHKYKFRGFQYDVEPYLLDTFKENPEPVLKNFIKLIDDTQKFLDGNNLKFSIVVPDFYDGQDQMLPKFSYEGKKDFVFDHLLTILDRQKNNALIVMSYRNFALGENGSIEVTQNEMQTAKNHHTKIIVAQETGDVPPPYITFHNTSKKYLLWEMEKIKSAFTENPNFGGLAIHYVNALLALR